MRYTSRSSIHARHAVRAWTAASADSGGTPVDGGGARREEDGGSGSVDAEHGGHRADGCRVSLVLEQYVVPEPLLPAATRFEVLRGE